MKKISVHDFQRQVICIYDNEQYSVRDNGAVLRHPRAGKRPRPTDNKWTFGKPNNQNGYMYISQKRIHRIVATVFHDEPPTPEHVVDHIDTNRQNNRPANLRWLTRLENVLKNPITRKRIEAICGSIDAFIENPSILGNSKLDPNFTWMRTVTPEEARACLKRLDLWAKSDKAPSGGSLGEWVFNIIPLKSHEKPSQKEQRLDSTRPYPRNTVLTATPPDLVMAKTLGAAQRRWHTPTEFPCCPQKEEAPLATYAEKLTVGAIFSRNDFSTHIVLEAAVIDDGQSIYVMCESDGMKPWSLAKITFEDGLYVHTSISTFFSEEGAEKNFYLARGIEWTSGDTFDDYC